MILFILAKTRGLNNFLETHHSDSPQDSEEAASLCLILGSAVKQELGYFIYERGQDL